MWKRSELKQHARKAIGRYYVVALLVALAAAIFDGGQRIGNPGIVSLLNIVNPQYILNAIHTHSWPALLGKTGPLSGPAEWLQAVAAMLTGAPALPGVLLFLAFRYAVRLFIGGPLETGMNFYFLEARRGRSDSANLISAFRGGKYLNIVKAIAWRELFTALWLLLFLVPGFIKNFSYGMVPYLMADNPGMGYRRAMRLSVEMTKGEKWRILLLLVSFWGWYLLAAAVWFMLSFLGYYDIGVAAFYIGTAIIAPYRMATMAELYIELRGRAVNEGLCNPQEVGLKAAGAGRG